MNELLGIQHLLTGKSISATAIALEPTTVLEISREDFDQLMKTDSALLHTVMGMKRSFNGHMHEA